MGKIDPRGDNPTVDETEEETELADGTAGEGDQAWVVLSMATKRPR